MLARVSASLQHLCSISRAHTNTSYHHVSQLGCLSCAYVACWAQNFISDRTFKTLRYELSYGIEPRLISLSDHLLMDLKMFSTVVLGS